MKTNSDSEILFTVKIPKINNEHSQHCNASAAEANAKRKERYRAKRIEKSKLIREQKLALRQAKKAAPQTRAKNVIIPAKIVTETQSINITVTSNVNIQVTESIHRKQHKQQELNVFLMALELSHLLMVNV